MSPQAVRVRTSSGWQDIAIQGAPGPPGRTPSCRAQSAMSFAAADTYYRGISLNFTTIVFDDFGNSFAGGVWTCRQSGRYLIIGSFEGLANTGNVGIAVGPKRTSSTVTKGADGNTWGTECVFIADYVVGNQLGVAGYHSGGGAGTFTFEAIRLDAPPISVPSSAPMRVTLAQFVALTPVDGMEVYLRADDTNGIVWHLRYNSGSASAYKWECISSKPLTAQTPDYDAVNVTTFGDLAHVGPSITIPCAGDYIVDFSADMRPGIAAGPPFMAMGLKIGSQAFTPHNDYSAWASAGITTNATATNGRRVRHDAIPAGAVCKLQYQAGSGGSPLVGRRWLAMEPVRIS